MAVLLWLLPGRLGRLRHVLHEHEALEEPMRCYMPIASSRLSLCCPSITVESVLFTYAGREESGRELCFPDPYPWATAMHTNAGLR